MYWEENFQKLKKIFLTKDNETVFLSDIEKTRLKVWTSAQRRAFKLGKLPQDKIDLLQEIQLLCHSLLRSLPVLGFFFSCV